MKQLRQSLTVARTLRKEQRPFAVATVVRIGGSTYRRPGARMLVDESGGRWGTISGGCLEGEVAQQALQVIADGESRVIPFELGEDDIVLGFGTGCNGTVHVLIEPVLPSESLPANDVLALIDRCFAARSAAWLVTVISAAHDGTLVGQHFLFPDNGAAEVGATREDLKSRVADAISGLSAKVDGETASSAEPEAVAVQQSWQNVTVPHDGGDVEFLCERVVPPMRLIIFGDGHDVSAMISVAVTMGWEIVVVGRKSSDELRARFPDAHDHVFLMHAEDAVTISMDSRSAVVIMNHNYVRDRTVLGVILRDQSTPPYVGLLGPAERTARMLAELSAEVTDQVYGPIGLDLGTETPEEIALATIAEIQSVVHKRNAQHLRDREGAIH